MSKDKPQDGTADKETSAPKEVVEIADVKDIDEDKLREIAREIIGKIKKPEQ